MNFLAIPYLTAAIVISPGLSQQAPRKPILFDAKVRLDAPTLPSGSPVNAAVEVINVSRSEALLSMDAARLPAELELVLSDPQGQTSKPRAKAQFGDAAVLPDPADFYHIKPGERVSFRYDFSRLFDLRRPGRYRLDIREPGRDIICSSEFEVLEVVTRQKLDIKGFCEHPLAVFDPGEPFSGEVVCRLEVGVGKSGGVELGFVTLSGVKFKDQAVARTAPALVIPPGARVESHALDIRGQLWAVLADGDRQALVIWDLTRGTTRTAISWGRHEIELGSTAAPRKSHVRIVIAGLKGHLKLSTLNDAAESVR